MFESMVFYSSFYEALDGFTDEQQLEVLKAIIEYGLYEKVPDLHGVLWSIFRIAKPLIDSNIERRKNGKSGGRKKSDVSKMKTIGFENENHRLDASKNEKPMVSNLKTIGFESENHRLEKTKPNENVNVNENAHTSSSCACAREEEDDDDGWDPDRLITTTDGTQIRLGDVHFGNTIKLGVKPVAAAPSNNRQPPLTDEEKERILKRLDDFKKRQAQAGRG